MWSLLRLLPPEVLTFIKRHTPARVRFAIRQRLGADYRRIPDKVTHSSDGRLFHIGPDPIYWAIYQGLEYEPEASGLVRRLMRRGDVVADVGANVGWYSTLFAQLVGKSGHVYAFEPVPVTCARLEENIVLNGMQDRVTVVGKALGATQSAAEIHLFTDRSAALASLSPLGSSTFTRVRVEVTSLDQFVSENGIPRIDMVKCDVEGAEFDVLTGASVLLANADAPMVLIELNRETLAQFGHTKGDLMYLLKSAGYARFFDLSSSRRLRRVHTPKDLDAMDLMICGKDPQMEARIRGSGISVVG
jgi:FkbM family methyltransferase